ncbi:MAG TPA: hypothetical protein DHV15_13530 [Treponema sp.]|uniref:Uncharacterized protein n=1 Tax=Treponema denticola (strain ATCC 35405 / DSM 14222 / CIP 103919 / JCM 8153 / KCTC 15104) TaxID=243275 RepID=Q73J40_TREDE|nr:hypothetical protein TDE_2736 [Treponema denticola ATCC 35405]HCY96506.1 hypothetical protein [Treponema sp.]
MTPKKEKCGLRLRLKNPAGSRFGVYSVFFGLTGLNP